MVTKMNYNESGYLGHRTRLKERFLNSQEGATPDYEVLELLLCYANPRKDMKPLAKKLISTYGSIAALVNLEQSSLEKKSDLGNSTIILLKLVKEMMIRASRAQVLEKPLISSSQELIDYLRVAMAHSTIELFRVIYLNKKNIIIYDDLDQKGTIDQVNIYPREILKKALYLDASAVILAHNHPSGKTQPSKSDIQMTRLIIDALKPINIVVHDHVIISQKEYFSFKSHGLI